MKKYLVLMCILFLFAMTGCQKPNPPVEIPPGNEGLANPWVDCESLEELNEKAPVTFEKLPDILDDADEVAYRYSEELVISEIIIRKDGDEIVIRKAPLRQDGETHRVVDISGDYNEYKEAAVVDGVDISYERYGNNGLISKVLLDSDIYSYAVLFSTETDEGFSEANVYAIITEIE